jgi:hypothetical protein
MRLHRDIRIDHIMTSLNIPVFQVAVTAGVLLVASGVAIATVPALRRRRPLVLTWVAIVGALVLAVLVNLIRLMSDFS